MKKLKYPEIGQYVLVTKFSDKDPIDPWYIGFVNYVRCDNNVYSCRVEGSTRLWNNFFSLTKKEGDAWLSKYGNGRT